MRPITLDELKASLELIGITDDQLKSEMAVMFPTAHALLSVKHPIFTTKLKMASTLWLGFLAGVVIGYDLAETEAKRLKIEREEMSLP